MKFRAIILILFFPFLSKAQHFNKGDFNLFVELQKTFSSTHYLKDELTPNIHKRLPSAYIGLLDPANGLFLEHEVEGLVEGFPSLESKYPTEFIQYLERIYSLLEKRLNEKKEILSTVEKQNFFANDSVYFLPFESESTFLDNLEELKSLWIRGLKYESLSRYDPDSSSQNSDHTENLNTILFQNIENEICNLESLIQEDEFKSTVLNSFLKAYARCFDPHSDFLSPNEIRSFTSSLSSENFGTGLVFVERGKKFIVVEKSPFSSAMKESDINIGDEIISLWIDNEFKPMACLSYSAIEHSFFGLDNKEVKVEIKSSKDKKIRTFSLTKRVVSNNENHTFSYLLKRDEQSIGYIQFPGFYSNFDGMSRSSSEDMALIFLQLREKNIDGLIIDLRGNGGGYVQEAIDLSSFLVDYGPLAVRSTTEKKSGTLMKDGKRGKLIDTKVIFLVNGATASASELLISSLRHYSNFLIVGSSTFGKASGYSTIPITPPYENEPRGFAQVTTLKLYNIDGSTYQTTGVIPDIEIPSTFNNTFLGEQRLKYALVNDRSNKVVAPIEVRDIPIDTLKEISANRISQSSALQTIKKINQSLEDLLNEGFSVSLNYHHYLNPLASVTNYPRLDSCAFEMISLEENEAFINESDKFKSKATQDPILNESFLILNDWISITNAENE